MPDQPQPEDPWEPERPYYNQANAIAPLRSVAPAEEKPALARPTSEATQRLLDEATQELINLSDSADALTVRRLTFRIQKLRVAVKIFADDEDGLSKEIGLLNRLMAGDSLQGGPVPDDGVAQAQVLKDRGIDDPASAGRVLRVLEAVMSTPHADSPTRNATG